MAIVQNLTSENVKGTSLRNQVTMPYEVAENVFSNKQELVITDQINPKRISKESIKSLTLRSAVKAVLVFVGTIGFYSLFKNTNILFCFGWGERNSKNLDNAEIMEVKNKANALSERTNLKTTSPVNNPSVNQIAQTYKGEDRAVKFKGIKVEEFKDFANVKKENIENRRSASRRSIWIQNPIPDQNVVIELPFNFTIYGTNVFSSSDSVFLEATNIPDWLISSYLKPTFKGSYYMSGGPDEIKFFENYAYMAAGDSGLQIIDISDPVNPFFIGSYYMSDWAFGVAISGNYAYVVAEYGDSGLQIIDISDPSKPMFKGSYEMRNGANGIALLGNYAYVVTYGSTGLQIIDISDPSNPIFKSSYDIEATGIALSGNYAYLASGSRLEIIDINDPSKPTFKGSYKTTTEIDGLALSGNYAYIADNRSGLKIIDISDPKNPTLKGSYDTPGFAFGIDVAWNYAYMALDAEGIQIIDVSDPSNPTFKSSYNFTTSDEIFVFNNYAYISDEQGLQIIAPNLDKLMLSGTPSLKGIYGIDIEGCNEENECSIDSFNVVVKEVIPIKPINVATPLIVIGSVAFGTICLAIFCVSLIICGFYLNKHHNERNVTTRRRNREHRRRNFDPVVFKNNIQTDFRDESTPILSQESEALIYYDDNESLDLAIALSREEARQNNIMPNFTEDIIPKSKNVQKKSKDIEFDEEPPENLCCSISHELMKDPVMVVESGQTYDRQSIESWFTDHNTDPLTQKEVNDKRLTTNFAIKSQVEEWIMNHKK